ncbi:MAG: hypothetical protein AABX93_02925 [Nanoarchaeota archaeon]
MRKIGNDKHGLSEIVISMIMIVLVLVAISIVWFIVRGILDKGSGQVNLGADCLEIQIDANKVINTTDDTIGPTVDYRVTLTRSAGGNPIGGVAIIFKNDTGDASYRHTAAGNIAPLETKTVSATGVTITQATKVEVVPYFLEDSGTEKLCSTSTAYEF